MKFEMATLYSTFAARRRALPLAFRRGSSERDGRINAMFYDVLRHFGRRAVAKRRQFAAAAVGLTAAFLVGCAGMGGLSADSSPEVKRDAVATRAKARWQHLIDRDLAGAYEFLSPASRATMPLDIYKAKHKVGMYRSVKVDSVECEADACTVKLSLTYDYKRIKGVTTPLVEKWIITQGQAWFVDQS